MKVCSFCGKPHRANEQICRNDGKELIYVRFGGDV